MSVLIDVCSPALTQTLTRTSPARPRPSQLPGPSLAGRAAQVPPCPDRAGGLGEPWRVQATVARSLECLLRIAQAGGSPASRRRPRAGRGRGPGSLNRDRGGPVHSEPSSRGRTGTGTVKAVPGHKHLNARCYAGVHCRTVMIDSSSSSCQYYRDRDGMASHDGQCQWCCQPVTVGAPGLLRYHQQTGVYLGMTRHSPI